MVMRDVKKAVLMTAFAVAMAVVPTAGFADERVEGKVIRAELTACDPRPAGGGCQGTLTLETKADGTARQVAITVKADTLIRKGQDHLLLPATQGSSVVVSNLAEKGQKVARTIDVIDVSR
jgi:hypothetical protein